MWQSTAVSAPGQVGPSVATAMEEAPGHVSAEQERAITPHPSAVGSSALVSAWKSLTAQGKTFNSWIPIYIRLISSLEISDITWGEIFPAPSHLLVTGHHVKYPHSYLPHVTYSLTATLG